MTVWDTMAVGAETLSPYSWIALGYCVGVLHLGLWLWLWLWQRFDSHIKGLPAERPTPRRKP